MGRLFGTDGVRGIANRELTASLAYDIGKAAAFVLSSEHEHPVFFIGKDTRISGDMLESALAAGIMSVGGRAVRLGVIPTPAVAYLVRKHGADAGVVISAYTILLSTTELSCSTAMATSLMMQQRRRLKILFFHMSSIIRNSSAMQ